MAPVRRHLTTTCARPRIGVDVTRQLESLRSSLPAGDAGRQAAYLTAEWETLLAQWSGGTRTREAALRLMFLSWYSCIEPAHLTGLAGVAPPEGLVDDLFGFLGGEESMDAEVLFVVAVMAEVASWCLGDERRWEGIADRFRARLGGLIPSPEVFSGRGEYGEYFAHQARASTRGAT